MRPPADSERYKHHYFPDEIISRRVWLYYRFTLRSRDVEWLKDRRQGLSVAAGFPPPPSQSGRPETLARGHP